MTDGRHRAESLDSAEPLDLPEFAEGAASRGPAQYVPVAETREPSGDGPAQWIETDAP